MLITKACNAITHISNDEKLNMQNYLHSLDYIGNLYIFLNELKLHVSTSKIKFLPSFKDKYIAEQLGIAASAKENEMKTFVVQSPLFLEDRKVVSQIKKGMSKICQEVTVSKDVMTFVMI
jgi:hypothetical protein